MPTYRHAALAVLERCGEPQPISPGRLSPLSCPEWPCRVRQGGIAVGGLLSKDRYQSRKQTLFRVIKQ